MSDHETELLAIARKIYGLLELLAEDKIAERDAKQRAELRRIVGTSKQKQKSVFLMDGTRTQKQIRNDTSVHQGNLSTMVGQLHKAKLLIGNTVQPHLAITIPITFFDTNIETE